jgi:hypothetical protein
MPSGPADYHFLHISVTADTDTVQEGFAGARQMEGYGYSTPPMVSYHDMVSNEGRYYEGQSYGVKGTHTNNDKKVPGYPKELNFYGYACALMQNVDDEVTDIQVRVVAMVFAARELKGLVRKGAPVLPHRMFAAKSCPGDKAMARLDEIIRLKNQYVQAGSLPGSEEDMSYSKWSAADKKAFHEDLFDAEVRDGVTVRRALLQGANGSQVTRNFVRLLARALKVDLPGDNPGQDVEEDKASGN